MTGPCLPSSLFSFQNHPLTNKDYRDTVILLSVNILLRGRTKMSYKSDLKCSFCDRTKAQVATLVAGTHAYICDRCIKNSSQIIAEQPLLSDLTNKKITPKDILQELDQWVIGQEKAKRALCVAVYNHYKRLSRRNNKTTVEIAKSNILLIGPSGCGKTHLAKSLAKAIDVPFAIADATSLTQAGYVGDDVETIITRLLHAAELNVTRAATGIVYLDEVDKLARRETTGQRDVGGEGVQQALLKILEGHAITVKVGGDRSGYGSQSFEIDTTNILFIAGGAFDGLAKVMGKDDRRSGFRPNVLRIENGLPETTQILPKDLQCYGFIPEFIGRLPVTVTLDELTEQQLADITNKPRDAVLRQYQELFIIDNSRLEATNDGLLAIARLAIKRGTGARGLRSIFEELLAEVMFDLPSQKGSSYLLDEAAVNTGRARKVRHIKSAMSALS